MRVLSLSILLGACGGPVAPAPDAGAALLVDPLTAGGLTEAPARHPRVDDELNPFRSQLEWRFIGRLQAPAACPPATVGWTGEKLFADFPRGSGLRPPALDVFCLYERIDPAAPDNPVTGQPPGFTLVQDRAVIADLAPTLLDVMQADLVRVTLDAAGPVPDNRTLTSGSPVRLSFLDTTPTTPPVGLPWNVLGHNDHGYALLNLARALTCDADGDCVVDLSSQLALDLRYDELQKAVRDEVNGGDFGGLGSLARAIREEVVAWQTDATHASLVINLSLGWEPAYGGSGGPATFDPAIHAVWSALRDAACRGALPIAAAGNRSGGPTGHAGPLYPAAWETHLLDAADCAARTGITGQPFDDVDGRPMIYGVGATTSDGDDVVTNRYDNRPGLMAFGDHAVVPDSGGNPTASKTGTSVAAAVVSSAAAVVWASQPQLSTHEVMDAVRASGAPGLPIDPPWCEAGWPCGDTRHIALCEAVEWVCDPASPGHDPLNPCVAAVSGTIDCPVAPPAPAVPDPALLATWRASAPTVAPDHAIWRWRTSPVCAFGTEKLHRDRVGRSPTPCPIWQFYTVAASPWVDPQPHSTDCPVCFISTSTGELYLERAVSWAKASSLTLTLTVSGDEKSLTTSNIPDTNVLEWTVPGSFLPGLEAASLSAVLNDTTYYSPIALVP